LKLVHILRQWSARTVSPCTHTQRDTDIR
jgi:hypothetical protein